MLSEMRKFEKKNTKKICRENGMNQLTTSDKMSERTRSPHSVLVSCPNWYRAPKNLRNLLSSLDGSVCWIGVADCGVDAADDVCGGDPPFWIGDVLPLAVRCSAKFVYCTFGEMGDRGATARTLSGDSGVRPRNWRKKTTNFVNKANYNKKRLSFLDRNIFLLKIQKWSIFYAVHSRCSLITCMWLKHKVLLIMDFL